MLEGEGLAGPLAAHRAVPGTAAQMIRVGEETGTLDDPARGHRRVLRERARLQDQASSPRFRAGVIIVMGLIVGFVAIALVSAMYGIFNQVEV